MGKFDEYINVTAPIHSATVKGKLGNANEIFLEGDTQNIENEIKEINSRHEKLNKKHDALSSKHESLSRTVQDIAVTGGASTANNVTYNNDASGLNAENAQDAIDEVSSIGHFAKRGGIVNISTNYNSDHISEVFTLEQAIAKVPLKDRVLGFQGKFLTSDGWHIIIYTGDSLTSWSDKTKWIDLADKIFNSISNNATFAGVATPTTNPGIPDGPVFYIASEPGIYVNFNNLEIIDTVCILKWSNGVWLSEDIHILTKNYINEKFSELSKKVNADEKETTFPSLTASFSVDEYNKSTESYIKIESGNDSVNTIVFWNVGISWNRLLNVAVNNNKIYKITIPETTNTIQVIHSTNEGEKVCKLKIYHVGTIPYDIHEVIKADSETNKRIDYANYDINKLKNKTLSVEAEYDDSKNEELTFETDNGIKCIDFSAEETKDTTDGIDLYTDNGEKAVSFDAVEALDYEDEQSWENEEDKNDVYAKVGSYGIKGKKFFEIDDTPIDIEFLRLAFSKWLCIGDSVTHGFVSDYPNVFWKGYFVKNVSTPRFLAKLTGITTINSGHGGYSSKEWWEKYRNSFDYSTIDLVTIQFGYNRGLTDTMATDVTPYSNYNDYANTDTGCYCKMIEFIKEQNPNIFIVLIVSAKMSNSYTEKVTWDIATKYGLNVITLYKDDYIDLNDAKLHGYLDASHQASGELDFVHFNAIGYLYQAKLILHEMSKIVFKNTTKVKNNIESRWCNADTSNYGYDNNDNIIISEMTTN